MKAISIQQPYAEAIIDGPKRVENRSRRLGLDGRWVWVQASRSFYFAREVIQAQTGHETRAMLGVYAKLTPEQIRGAVCNAGVQRVEEARALSP